MDYTYLDTLQDEVDTLLAKIKSVKKAIPQGRALRRCVLAP